MRQLCERAVYYHTCTADRDMNAHRLGWEGCIRQVCNVTIEDFNVQLVHHHVHEYNALKEREQQEEDSETPKK